MNETQMATQRTTRKAQLDICRAMLGCSIYHEGEHGTVIAYSDDYQVPMVVVRFQGRAAILMPSEIGALS